LQLELLTFGQFCKGVKSSVTFEKNPLILNHVNFYTTPSHCVGREFPGIRMRQQKQWLATKIVGMLLIICCGDSKEPSFTTTRHGCIPWFHFTKQSFQ